LKAFCASSVKICVILIDAASNSGTNFNAAFDFLLVDVEDDLGLLFLFLIFFSCSSFASLKSSLAVKKQ